MSEWIAKPIKDGRKHLGDEYMGDLIRCRDCKRNKSDKWVDCPITEMYGRTTDNYCSLAERREA